MFNCIKRWLYTVNIQMNYKCSQVSPSRFSTKRTLRVVPNIPSPIAPLPVPDFSYSSSFGDHRHNALSSGP